MTTPTEARAPDCKWFQEEEEGDTWQTQCGHYATVNSDTPLANDMHFCWYCGGKLIEVPYELEEPESDE